MFSRTKTFKFQTAINSTDTFINIEVNISRKYRLLTFCNNYIDTFFQAEYLKCNNKPEQSGRAAVKNFVSGYIVFAKKEKLIKNNYKMYRCKNEIIPT